MERKQLVWLGLTVGSLVGGYIPSLWDPALFSVSSIIGSAIGGILGIWIGFKMGE